jgi:hypothetical protein
MEYVYLSLDVWTFSEEVDPLLGINILGVPIEEFVFWWGASPLFIFVYLGYERLLKRLYKKHPTYARSHWPAPVATTEAGPTD